MDIVAACKITSAVICDFLPCEYECDTCEKDYKQLYFLRTDFETLEGEYLCKACVIALADKGEKYSEVFYNN